MQYDISSVVATPNNVIRCRTMQEAEALQQIIIEKYPGTLGCKEGLADLWSRYGEETCYNLNQYNRHPFQTKNKRLLITYSDYDFYIGDGYKVTEMSELIVVDDSGMIDESAETIESLFF